MAYRNVNESAAQTLEKARQIKKQIDADAVAILKYVTNDEHELTKGQFMSVRKFIKELGVQEVIEAAHIALDRMSLGCSNDVFLYFCGVCWNKIRSQQEEI